MTRSGGSLTSGRKPDEVIFWCDSTIVLQWLRAPPRSLKTYVAARVTEIQQNTEIHRWRHVRSKDNPADAISRGQLPHAFLRNESWVSSPPWLRKDASEWPNEILPNVQLPELRTNMCLAVTYDDLGLFQRYSSFSRLTRIVAYCLRFRRTNKHRGSLRSEEINEAETRILRRLQGATFANEIRIVKGKQAVTKGRLANLNPFLDNDGLIRVGGRLHKSTRSRKNIPSCSQIDIV